MARRARKKKGQRAFSASVARWVQRSKGAMEVIWKMSAQELFIIAKGNAPVDTGFMRAGFVASIDTPVPISGEKRRRPEGHVRGSDIYGSSQRDTAISLVINNARLGEVIYGTWTASYAVHLEYGTKHMKAVGMTRRAAQKWPQIVREQTAIVRKRFGQ